MKRNRFYFGLLILMLVMIAGWTSYSMLNVGKTEKSHKVSVIVADSNNDRWSAMHQGLEQAAGDCNINLNYVSTGELTDADEELALINREVENGAEGIIVQMTSGEENSRALEEISGRAAVVLLESDVLPEDLFALVGPDNYAMGAALAEAIKEQSGEELAGKTVGILTGNQSQLAIQQRLLGVTEGLSDTSAQILWTVEQLGEQEETVVMQKLERADIIIALENEGTERMVDYLTAREQEMRRCLLYGVGCSEKAVYYLDKGMIQTLVVPNEFNMGYLSMEAIADQLRYHLPKASNSQVDYLVIDKANLYEADNQKILFPIVQ